MSYSSLLIHRLLIAHPDPAASADTTGQLFVDETGQPVGDATVNEGIDWAGAMQAWGRVRERTAKWPDGVGTGAELVDTQILLEPDAPVHELDKIKWMDDDPALFVDPDQVYQVVFVHQANGRSLHHLIVQARRIPL